MVTGAPALHLVIFFSVQYSLDFFQYILWTKLILTDFPGNLNYFIMGSIWSRKLPSLGGRGWGWVMPWAAFIAGSPLP
jgi:hypothetical protein